MGGIRGHRNEPGPARSDGASKEWLALYEQWTALSTANPATQGLMPVLSKIILEEAEVAYPEMKIKEYDGFVCHCMLKGGVLPTPEEHFNLIKMALRPYERPLHAERIYLDTLGLNLSKILTTGNLIIPHDMREFQSMKFPACHALLVGGD